MVAWNLDIILAYVSGQTGEKSPGPLPHLPYTSTCVSAAGRKNWFSWKKHTHKKSISFQLIKSLICFFVQPHAR